MLASAALLLAFGCKGSSNDAAPATAAETVAVSGTVTYVRIPAVTDANGVPTGPETDTTKYVTLPAPGVFVRFIQKTEETLPDGVTKATVWKAVGSTVTSATGTYSSTVPKNSPIFVELITRFSATGLSLRLIGDVAIGSSIPQADRRLYSLRKGLDGSDATAPAFVPATSASVASTVNFTVGLNDPWLLTQEALGSVGDVTKISKESVGTGSRALAIGASAVALTTAYGSPIVGNTLDLHYQQGVSETRGTFIEFDNTVYPASFDGGTGQRHFFGSIRGGAANDDAFDEGVLFALLARANLFSQNPNGLLPVNSPLTNLTPELAVQEGLADAMAATLLKSPYLADLTAASATVRDIRDLSSLPLADKSPYSAPLISALAWDLILKANSLPNPGVTTDWAKIDPLATLRFFQLRAPVDTTSIANDLVSLYGQLARLKEAKGTGETVDLAAIFPDTVLTPLVSPFNITWPRPTEGEYASFLLNWGADPNSLTTALPAISLSMAKAEMVNGVYPNVSAQELAFARFTLSKDTAYNVSIQTVPASLLAEGQVEILIDSQVASFAGSASPAQRLTFLGSATTPLTHRVRVRLLSANALQPDTQVTVRLDKAP